MHVTLVHVRVAADAVDDFLDATRANHEGSIREPGCVRFDVLQAADDPTRFVLYEAYVDEAAALAHKATVHYQALARHGRGLDGGAAPGRPVRRPLAGAAGDAGARDTGAVDRTVTGGVDSVERFDLGRLPRIVFGPGRVAEVPSIVARHGRRALVVTGRQSLRRSPRWTALIEGLARAGVAVVDMTVDGEPSPELVDLAVGAHRDRGVDVVVAVGGGSVLDTGKAVAGLLRAETTALDHLEGVGHGLPYAGPAVPFVAIPTTAGTGSEATRNAVLSRTGPGGFKKSFRDERLVARDAVVDPDLLVGLPPAAIAANGLDALTQLLESLASTRSFAFSRALALDGLAAVRDGLVPWFSAAVADRDLPAARSRMAYAALLSGIVLAHTGLGAVHGLASALGARHPIGHGAACGAALVAATRVNLAALEQRDSAGQGLARYAEAGRVLAGPGLRDDRAARRALVDTLAAWTDRLGIHGLAALGVGESDLAPLVAEARGTSMRTNPIALTDEEIEGIVRASL